MRILSARFCLPRDHGKETERKSTNGSRALTRNGGTIGSRSTRKVTKFNGFPQGFAMGTTFLKKISSDSAQHNRTAWMLLYGDDWTFDCLRLFHAYHGQQATGRKSFSVAMTFVRLLRLSVSLN
ncbi:hypothetical protein J6590_053155 [Homalodisca vitripennis]|nr:hypothetical protein J6590_053155 [Homalodisca vitripennis]